MSNNTNTDTMPLLVIEATGEIVRSNFAEFDTAARQWLSDINRNLRTDEDFDEAAENVKKAKQVEDLLAATRDAVLAKAETLNAELEKLSGLSGAMREARLELSKQIDKAKAEQRAKLIEGALGLIECAPSRRGKFQPAIEAAVKGLKTLDSMREKARIQITIANDGIRRCKRLLDEFEAANGKTLTPDREALECGDYPTLATELSRRLERAQAEAREKRLREEAAKQVAAAKAREEAAKAELEAAKAKPANVVPMPAPAAGKPEPEPVTDMPWEAEPGLAPEPLTAAEEWSAFRAAVVAAFTSIKAAREAMKHQSNIEAATAFGGNVNAAWAAANAMAKGGHQQ